MCVNIKRRSDDYRKDARRLPVAHIDYDFANTGRELQRPMLTANGVMSGLTVAIFVPYTEVTNDHTTPIQHCL